MNRDSVYKVLYVISTILLLLFVMMLGIDYSRYRAYSAPFYIYVITRIVEFVIPSIIAFVIGSIVKKKCNEERKL